LWAAGGATGTWSRQAFTPGSAPVAGYEGAFFSRTSATSGGSSTELGFLQFIEDVRTFAGQTVTFSFWAKADSARTVTLNVQQRFGTGGSANISKSTTQAITTSWTRYTYTVALDSLAGKTISATDSSLAVYIYLGAGQASGSPALDIWGVQLEAGPAATPFRRNAPSIAAELAACQRYYWRTTSALSNYAAYGSGTGISATTARINSNCPVQMRVPPTSVDFANISFFDGVTLYAASGLVLDSGLTTSLIASTAATSSGLTAYRPYFMITNNLTTGFVGFSAEL
jgi:hypothetical protein